MLVLGVNLGRTFYGKRLYDGGACLIDESGIVCAMAEERVTRVKHAGGYHHAAKYCLSAVEIEYTNLDLICVSSCVEPLRQIDISLGLPLEVLDRVRIVPHHLSHAYSAFHVSPFDEAIIMVVDGGGDVLEPMSNTRWWEYGREQHTYYVGTGKNITMLERQFHQPHDVGLGEMYRCFTEYLGFETFFNANKLMSIAAYGEEKPQFSDLYLYYYEDGHLRSTMQNFPPRVVEMVQRWATQQGVTMPPQRTPSEPIAPVHCNLAKFVQNQLEEAFLGEVRRLQKITGIKNLCIAGGVGLNCVLSQKILRQTQVENIFVQPAPGDTGQCLGNALFGTLELDPDYGLKGPPFSVYLGKQYELDSSQIESLSHADHFRIRRPKDLVGEVATLLTEGKIVAWFQGRAEFGPRALGNRSILADSRFSGVAKRVAKIKGREEFRPFAPSVLLEEAGSFFDLLNYDYSYMTIVATAKAEVASFIRPVLHVDGTSRIHIVDKTVNSRYYALISRYHEITGIPMVLNTSFNRRGEPIVETPLDAMKSFRQMDIDILVIGELIIEKLDRLNLPQHLEHRTNSQTYTLSDSALEGLIKQIVQDYPNMNVAFRRVFGLQAEYWDWILTRRKTTTIRYRPGALDIPLEFKLPVDLATPNPASLQKTQYNVAELSIKSIEIKHFGELTVDDAIRDGFKDLQELKSALCKFYGPVQPNELVTIYQIFLHNGADKSYVE